MCALAIVHAHAICACDVFAGVQGPVGMGVSGEAVWGSARTDCWQGAHMDWDLGSDPAGLLSHTWSLLSPCAQEEVQEGRRGRHRGGSGEEEEAALGW